MRPFFAIAVAAVILGGLQIYMSSRPAPQNANPPPEILAEGKFDIELTLTFDAAPDPFAFDSSNAYSVAVMFEGKDIIRRTEPVEAGLLVLAEDIASVDEGRNEFFVEAIPKDSFELKTRGLRIRILRDGIVIGETSLWSEPGSPVAGTIVVETPNAPAEDHTHDADGADEGAPS